jgi:hypothetical protein
MVENDDRKYLPNRFSRSTDRLTVHCVVHNLPAWHSSQHPTNLNSILLRFRGNEGSSSKDIPSHTIVSAGKRGNVIESLFIRIREGSRSEEFSFWGYGDKDLVSGSGGIFVPETGVVTYHHFNPVDSDSLFLFSKGTYSLELVAKIIGRKQLASLWTTKLEMPPVFSDTATELNKKVFFNWSPE